MAAKFWCPLVIALVAFGFVGCTHRGTTPKKGGTHKESLKVVSSVDPKQGIETLDYAEPGLTVHATREFKYDRASREYRCTAMTMNVNGTEISLPYNSYSDAFSYDNEYPCLDLDRDEKGLILEFSGGDGAATHHITYRVAKSKLRQMTTVRYGPVPDKDGRMMHGPIGHTVDVPD